MIEPIEAEFAIPPVYTDQEERALQNQETDIASNPSSTIVISQSPHQSHVDPPTEKTQGEIVQFDEGESPREWSAGKKWYVNPSIPRPVELTQQVHHHGYIWPLFDRRSWICNAYG
jgi:hypothetical protein